VEVVDGPRASTFAATDNVGRFSMPGTFSAGSIMLAASKDGYVRSTQSLTLREGPAGVTFWLELTTPSVNIAGEYTLTLTADSTCTPPTWESPLGWGLPDVARTRTYAATIARTDRSTSFQGTLTGATFVGRFNTFFVNVASDFASFSFDDFCSPSIVEALGDSGYLAIDAEARGSVGASGTTIPLDGYFQYCPPGKALMFGNGYQCSTVTPVTSVTCVSRNHRLTLTRR
jgi:hypothetical protein